MKSFKERISKFWEAFVQEEGEIRSMMDNKADGVTLINFMDSILAIAFNQVYFEMGVDDDNKYELILTPEGDRAKFFELQYWLQMAPPQLCNKWNFYSSKPGKSDSDFSMTMFELTITKKDFILYYQIDKNQQKLNIRVQCQKLMSIEEKHRYSMFLIFLDQFIGEIYTMEYIGYIEFVSDPQDMPTISLVHLKRLIDESITENEWFQIDNICEKCIGYQMKPSELKEWQLREDIYIGYSACFAVLNAFYDQSEELFESYKVDGVYWGFLFYENTNIEKDQLVLFRAQIEREILEIAVPQKIADTIGGATGFHFSYMDFIIYDIEAFMRIAKSLMSKYNFEESGFSNFIFADKPVFFEK